MQFLENHTRFTRIQQHQLNLPRNEKVALPGSIDAFWSVQELPFTETSCYENQEFVRARESTKHSSEKPLLLYLPGFDGIGISAFSQFEEFACAFEFWRLRIASGDDRSTFRNLVDAVVQFVLHQEREVVILGESFGGLLALGAALKLQEEQKGCSRKLLRGIVAVNPATCFGECVWKRLAPTLFSLEGAAYKTAQLLWIAVTMPDGEHIIRTIAGGPVSFSTLLSPTRFVRGGLVGFGGRLSSCFNKLQQMTSKLSQHSLRWRISEWLENGVKQVNPYLHHIRVPVMVIAGDGDRLLPSKIEAQRLRKIISDCDVKIFQSGHAVMLDKRINMTEVILNAHFMKEVYPTITKSITVHQRELHMSTSQELLQLCI